MVELSKGTSGNGLKRVCHKAVRTVATPSPHPTEAVPPSPQEKASWTVPCLGSSAQWIARPNCKMERVTVGILNVNTLVSFPCLALRHWQLNLLVAIGGTFSGCSDEPREGPSQLTPE